MKFKMRMYICCLLVTLLIDYSKQAEPVYLSKVPNARMVDDPCRSQVKWLAIGHQSPQGEGELNKFGKDFIDFGNEWNDDMCNFDSDGDGKTNGAELGDPDCRWSPGSSMQLKPVSGHPGVCEPTFSDACQRKNIWMENHCRQDTSCIKIDDNNSCEGCFLITPVELPVEPDTNPYYTCQRFTLPQEGQLIGMRPFWRTTNTKKVVEELTIYGCPDDVGIQQSTSPYATHEMCSEKPPQGCNTVLFRWRKEWGDGGYCIRGNYGYKVQPHTGYHYVIVQSRIIPDATANITTYHGVELYMKYVRERENDAATLTIGPKHLAIPARRNAVNESGFCSSECTEDILTADINVAAVAFHMNQLGRKMLVETWKDGNQKSVIISENYDTEKPAFVTLSEPIRIEKGEELMVTCTFDSSSRLNPTYSNQEDCEATLIYYPQQMSLLRSGLGSCSSYNSIDTCSVLDQRNTNQCIMEDFYSSTEGSSLLSDVLKYCFLSDNPYCSNNCAGRLKRAYQDHACLRGDMKYVFLSYLRSRPYDSASGIKEKIRFDQKVYSGMASCHGRVDGDRISIVDPVENRRSTVQSSSSNNAAIMGSPIIILLLVLVTVPFKLELF